MSLSICMIVKNEELNLPQCLKSLHTLADEIIIVDTGSKDRTKVIAAQYTQHVYDFAWCNDFAKARNFSIEQATGPWVLILDADEVVESVDKKSLQRFMTMEEKCVGRLQRINAFEDDLGVKKYIERVNRLFHKAHYHYEGIIHEQVTAKNHEQYPTQNIDLCVHHIGYMKEVLGRTNKIQRNLDMLHEAVQAEKNDPYLFYQLGKTYFMAKQYQNASLQFETALTLPVDFRHEYVEDLVESYGYALINSNQMKQAMDILQYASYYKTGADFQFLVGMIYMNNALFDKAVQAFEACMQLEEGKVEGITSFLPAYNIGVIYECLGHKEQARKYYKKCGSYIPAVKRMKEMGI